MSNDDRKLIIWYSEDGKIVTEFNYDKRYEELINAYDAIKNTNKTLELKYCTELGILMVQIAIVRKVIPCENIVFRFKNMSLFPNKYGILNKWPEGFFTKIDSIHLELLESMVEE
ncbi:MAG: hypothetical protein ACOCUI_00715 [bacterium]